MSTLTINSTYGNYGTLTLSATTSTTTTNPGYMYTPYIVSTDPYEYSELSNASYEIIFSDDVDEHLKDSIESINGNLLTFNCDFDDKKRIQPYELIMKMLREKRKFDITIKVSDILTVKYQGVKFKKIKNNFSFFGDCCNFKTLNVKIKCKNIFYENHRLDITEKRKEKLEKLIKL